MAELVEGLVQQFIHHATDPFRVAILIGVVYSFFWAFKTLLSFTIDLGLPPTRAQPQPFRVEIDELAALTVWKWASGRARMPGAVSGTAFLMAWALDSRPDLRFSLLAAFLLAYSYVLFAIVVAAPVARDILATPDPEQTEILLNKWVKCLVLKAMMPIVAFSLSVLILSSVFFE